MEPRASGAVVRQSMGQVHDSLHAACAAMINSTCRHKSWACASRRNRVKRNPLHEGECAESSAIEHAAPRQCMQASCRKAEGLAIHRQHAVLFQHALRSSMGERQNKLTHPPPMSPAFADIVLLSGHAAEAWLARESQTVPTWQQVQQSLASQILSASWCPLAEAPVHPGGCMQGPDNTHSMCLSRHAESSRAQSLLPGDTKR